MNILHCNSDRIAAIKITLNNGTPVLVLSVYMPTDSKENLPDFVECLGEVSAIIDSSNCECVFVLGDFNSHPGRRFGKELLCFCKEEKLSWADLELLGESSGTYTYVSDVCGSTSWLDHCLLTDTSKKMVTEIKVKYNVYWSDHLPLELICNFKLHVPSKINVECKQNKVLWGQRSAEQIDNYLTICNDKLKSIDFPEEFQNCADYVCNNFNHRNILNNMYKNIVETLQFAASKNCNSIKRKNRHLAGWNKHVYQSHQTAREKYLLWTQKGRPSTGRTFEDMRLSRKIFKSRLKWCQNNQEQVQMDILASQRASKDFRRFWRGTNKLNIRPSVSDSIEGERDPQNIANVFRQHFAVASHLGKSEGVSGGQTVDGRVSLRFSAKEIHHLIKHMTRGKSPGHDGLSIEHLQYAGKHLPRVLALFFSMCISHGYLPEDLMRTVVVPVVKSKTGDISDKANYRPISLATTMAKVLDGLINRRIGDSIPLHSAQFGFRPGLSTESAIYSLKHAVKYYTSRNTPVYACFLDLSKAFDLVSYDVLWKKLQKVGVAGEIVSVLQYWYANQTNRVRWLDKLSDVYGLECGVRQGGLTSPTLFNLYMNDLIVELSSMHAGCYIDGIAVNNISYADDMVLLSPTIGALRKMLSVCEGYALQHGMKYNAKKCEMIVFKAGQKCPVRVPPVMINGAAVKRVSQFKYLGHIVTEDLRDDLDMDRERRALSVRCNMIARRFARCSKEVKITLFKAYCQSFYTCSLWVNYTQKTYKALCVQYNNALRMLLGMSRQCSASKMFADANIDDFYAIIRKRCASLMHRNRTSDNSILKTMSEKYDCQMLGHWVKTLVFTQCRK